MPIDYGSHAAVPAAAPIDYGSHSAAAGATTQPSGGDPIAGLFEGLSSAPILHPIDSAKQMFDAARYGVEHPLITAAGVKAHYDQMADRAEAAWHRGDYAESALHLLSAAVPMLGPTLSDGLDKMLSAKERGDTEGEARAAGELIGMAGTAALLRNAPKVIETAQKGGPAIAAGVKAAAPPLGTAAMKGAAGYVVGQALPGAPEWVKGALGVAGAGKDVAEGLKQGVAAARDAYRQAGQPTSVGQSAAQQAAPAAPAQPGAPPAPAPQPGPPQAAQGTPPVAPQTQLAQPPPLPPAPAPQAPPKPAYPPAYDDLAARIRPGVSYADLTPPEQKAVARVFNKQIDAQLNPKVPKSAAPEPQPPAAEAPPAAGATSSRAPGPPPAQEPPGAQAPPSQPRPSGPAPNGSAAQPPPPEIPPRLISLAQLARYAAENGISEDDAQTALEAQNTKVVTRSLANRMLHGIGGSLGYDHNTLSDIAKKTYGVDSMARITDDQMLELVDRLGNEQATKPELARKTPAPAPAEAATAPEGSDMGGVVAQVPISEIHADPARFQFKRDAGQGGAGEELRAVQSFDPEKSGIVSVWRDPADGKTYVVNGHNRLALAQRLGAKDLTVRYLDAKDAVEARTKGALINIAEGRGDGVDAAKVFRDAGIDAGGLEAQGISLRGQVAKQGLALANLDPQVFRKVTQGDMTPERGAILGSIEEAADQRAMADLIERRDKAGDKTSDDQIREMIRLAPAPVEGTQETLFGTNQVGRSLIPEKADVSAYIQRRLAQDRRLFKAAGSATAAERLGTAGNVIQHQANAQIAEHTSQEQMLYDRLSRGAGTINDQLNSAAAEIAKGGDIRQIKEQTYAAIKAHLRAQAEALTQPTVSPGERPQGPAQPGQTPAGTGQPGAGTPDLVDQLRQSLANARAQRNSTLRDLTQ